MSNTVTITPLDGEGSFTAYIAEPADGARAAVVVIQEIFGVNRGIRAKCDALAADGFLAVAPDLFWRIEPGIELDPDVPEQLEEGLRLMGQFDQQKAVEDIEATLRAARARLGDDGNVGVVGYCLGGRLAYLAAARTDTDASVGYYPVGIDQLLDESHAIARPLILHIAQEDHFVDKAQQARVHAGLDDHPRVTLYDYAGVDHGFATQFGERRAPEAADLADERTLAFFRETLA